MGRKPRKDYTVRVKITPAPDQAERYARILSILREVAERVDNRPATETAEGEKEPEG